MQTHQRTEDDRKRLEKEIKFVETSAKQLGLTPSELIQMAGFNRSLHSMWTSRLEKGKVTKLRNSTVRVLHDTVRSLTNEKDQATLAKMKEEREPQANDKKVDVDAYIAKQKQKWRGFDASVDETTRMIAKYEAEAKRLGVPLGDIAGRAGYKRTLIRQWQWRLKTHGLPTWFRGPILYRLNKAVQEIERERSGKPVEQKVAEIVLEAVEAGKLKPQPAPAPVMQAIYAADFDDKATTPAPKATSGCQALQQIVIDKVRGMTLVQLAQLLAFIEGK